LHDQRKAVPALQAITAIRAVEVLCSTRARDQRVVPVLANKDQVSAVTTQQAIGIVAAIGLLSVTPARNQRVIPSIAKE